MEKKKLCVFTLYADKGASSQYRVYIFKEVLEKNYEVKWYHFWNNNYVTKYMHNKKKYCLQIIVQYCIAVIKRWIQLMFIAPSFDIVFLQKASIPKFKNTFLGRIKRNKVRVVFDVDDAIYEIEGDNSDQIAQVSDCVICGNNILYDHYSRINRNCVLIPTVDNTFRYIPYWSDTFHDKIIGWIGSKTTIDNLDLIIDALNIITEKHPEVKIAIISNTALDYTHKINNSCFIKWSSETYLEEMSRFCIGIMPLKNTPINQGKCGFKLVQYLNMKKPVIGSGVGINSDIIEGNGIIASSIDEWVEGIEHLLFNRAFYEVCVSHIENVFFDTYHYSKIATELVDVLIR